MVPVQDPRYVMQNRSKSPTWQDNGCVGRFVILGEIVLRLKSPGHERPFQSPLLETTLGGGESNVVIALANYGLDAAFVTALPGTDIADACIREVLSFDIDSCVGELDTTEHEALSEKVLGI
jgi:hypothetical protein